MSVPALLTVTAYVVLAAAAVGLEVVARLHPERATSFARLLEWALRRRSTQLGVVFVWWWLGWHLVTAR